MKKSFALLVVIAYALTFSLVGWIVGNAPVESLRGLNSMLVAQVITDQLALRNSLILDCSAPSVNDELAAMPRDQVDQHPIIVLYKKYVADKVSQTINGSQWCSLFFIDAQNLDGSYSLFIFEYQNGKWDFLTEACYYRCHRD